MTAVAVASDEKLLSADEFWALPESCRPMELVRGRIVYSDFEGPRHGQLCGRMAGFEEGIGVGWGKIEYKTVPTQDENRKRARCARHRNKNRSIPP